MTVLTKSERTALDKTVQAGRVAAERAAVHELGRLGVSDDKAPGYLTDDERALRRDLRAKARQLGDELESGPPELLIGEIAYEQWHRLLFARFLEVNGLLRHPEYGVAVTIEECESLRLEFGEPDGWSLAARFASEILPGVFRTGDPCVRVRPAPEDLARLETLVVGLPEKTLLADDALGWVYQFWQTAQKKKVNDSGRKIGGADIAPVTQWFTEDYMVRFLLENSLGAWWAGKHPDSPLLKDWEYLRFLDDGTPAAGTFDQWPQTAAEVTVMDPCCGSGHFLVAAFNMLWQMRVEEEGLSPVEAQDAVIRDNLFGLEIDPRCTQIAMFNVVLEAWKQGGYRSLTAPSVGCSGVGIAAGSLLDAHAPVGAGYDSSAVDMRALFRDAAELGSLIRPPAGAEQLTFGTITRDSADSGQSWADSIAAQSAESIRMATSVLNREYALVVTNPPYLGSGLQSDTLRRFLQSRYPLASGNLATAMISRLLEMTSSGGATGFVTIDNWRFLTTYASFREYLHSLGEARLIGTLGNGAFSVPLWDFPTSLWVMRGGQGRLQHKTMLVDAAAAKGATGKSISLASAPMVSVVRSRETQPWVIGLAAHEDPLNRRARLYEGTKPGQTQRVVRKFWELCSPNQGTWQLLASSPDRVDPYSGLQHTIRTHRYLSIHISESNQSGTAAMGRRGVLIQKIGSLRASLYTGSAFDNNTFVIQPDDPSDLPGLWAFISSADFYDSARAINQKLDISIGAVGSVAFDRARWQAVAEEAGPLPEPYSNDPTQWLFKGDPADSTEPLQVAVARLLGYRWPDQEPDHLDELGDTDGIVCLPPVGGERTAADRLTELLARAFGDQWSTALLDKFLTDADGKPGDLAGWLRDKFFTHHCKVFQQRPFIWHISDGRPDGFSALVNYHRLDNGTLSKLTYTTLGSWITRQRADADGAVPGADVRLAFALALQARLKLILDGETPFDIYVRWKKTSEQPIGWHPDLDDGVRLNIRPFVTAGALRSTPKIKWEKDRGKNPDGTDRINDLHLTLAQKRTAQAGASP